MILLPAAYFILLGYQTGRRLPESVKHYRFFFGLLVAGCLGIIAATIIYYLHAITPLSVALLFLAGSIALFFFEPKPYVKKIKQEKAHHFNLTTLVATTIPLVLFLQLITARTTEVLVSPWQALPTSFFLLYGLGIVCLFWHALRSRHSESVRWLTSAYLLVGYSVAAIIYIYGFGFDGFIHRATEEWIATHGFIDPKTPYYIGQYSLVVAISQITTLPIALIDIFLVPVLSALTLPTFFGYSLSKKGFSTALALLSSLLVPFAYFLTLNLTTPHNLVLLLFVLCICSLVAVQRHTLPWWFPLLLALVALLTHPLLGAPLLLFVAAELLQQRLHKNIWKHLLILFFFAALTLLPTIMFSLNNVRAGFGWPEFLNPLQKLPEFFALAKRPYWFAANAGIILDSLYHYQRLIAPLLFVFALIGSFGKQTLKHYREFAWLGAISFILGAWLLHGWVYFPGVAEAEQEHYPFRLLWASVIFLLPLTAIGCNTVAQQLMQRAQKQSKHFAHSVTTVLILGAAAMLMVSLYFAYPQRNAKVFFPGYNVTSADIAAVNYIAEQEAEQTYIVLSNALTSVAALRELGFFQHFQTAQGEIFAYPIPTGGPLYAYYLDMIYQGQKPETMQAAMEFAGVDTAYFVISDYWAKSKEIIAEAQKTADAVHVIENGKVVIFRYDAEE